MKKRFVIHSVLLFTVFLFCNESFSEDSESPAPKPASSDGENAKTENAVPCKEPGKKNENDKHMQMMRKILANLPPEEIERLKILRKENPEAFKEEMRKRITQRQDGKWRNELDKNTRESLDKYLKSSSDEEKTQLKSQIKESLKKEYDKKMEANRQRLENAEKQVKELRDKYEQRKNKADEIIEERFKELTKDPSLKW